ncbi:hypothetical protein [Pseudomonas sp. TCU-HL1]|uniref:hypothetical protein n=1 Tax=Pseudomonas sp. TCU-HL1 TaxID=1856685 RepID=UPI00083DB384|nr:hypothetical protein [Pseudomonas sp. TCU-HL1]AOE86120.1 hypothetical protein THL1_3572 [Pseudomonas sp. TCU-HL1]
MAKTQQERDQETEERRVMVGEVELRHSVKIGTRKLLDDLMNWHGYTQWAEAIQVLVLNFHTMGAEAVPAAAIRESSVSEPLRHRARPGVRRKLEDITRWLGLKKEGHALEHSITHAHWLGRSGSNSLLAIPRHEFQISENVARLLMAEGISLADRELRQELKDEWRD